MFITVQLRKGMYDRLVTACRKRKRGAFMSLNHGISFTNKLLSGDAKALQWVKGKSSGIDWPATFSRLKEEQNSNLPHFEELKIEVADRYYYELSTICQKHNLNIHRIMDLAITIATKQVTQGR